MVVCTTSNPLQHRVMNSSEQATKCPFSYNATRCLSYGQSHHMPLLRTKPLNASINTDKAKCISYRQSH
eukprot:606352-Pelagomonas_calceolata.AAC.2